MLRYLSERLGTAVLSLFGVTMIVFIVSHVLPGNAAAVRAGQYASPQQIAQISHQYGLDRPILDQFGTYLSGIVHGTLGTSIRTGQPVMSELASRIPATIELSVAALLISLAVGIPLGVLAAAKRSTPLDGVIRGVTLLMSSTAVFWAGLMAIFFLCNQLHVFPSPIGQLPRNVNPPAHITGSYVVDALLEGNPSLAWTAVRSLLLPALTLGLVTAAPVIKIVRSAMSSALNSDYVRTSRAFGLPRRTILFHDAFRNSLLPILTSIGIVAGYLIGGNIIVEQLFSWPGIGQYAYESLQAHDLDAVQGFVLLVGLGYIVLNLVLDLLYVKVDPGSTARSAMSTSPATTTVASPTIVGRTLFYRRKHRKSGKAALWIGVGILFVLVVLSIVVPLAATSATTAHAADSLLAPSWTHVFGTDRYGRDVFVRCMAAMHIDLLLAFVVAAAALTVGSIIGSVSGLAGRYIDEIIMRLTDILMAFPAFVLALVITACLGNSTVHAVIGITVAYTPYFIRLTRSRALSVRTLDYVAAARLAGTSGVRLAVRHVMPNSIQPALVQATLVAAWGILDIAGLSFLGVGVQPPTPEWGAMIADGYSDILSGQWWTALFPGLMILVTAAAFHLIGDTLDAAA